MRSHLLIFSLLAVPLSLIAEDSKLVSITDTINSSGNINIIQPPALTNLLQHRISPDAEAEEANESAAKSNAAPSSTRTGYRVQIFEDNDPRSARRQAEHYHAEIASLFPHIRSYVTFNSPYWRVKAGDFRTRSEAEAAMAEFREAFPKVAGYMRVVRDKINSFD